MPIEIDFGSGDFEASLDERTAGHFRCAKLNHTLRQTWRTDRQIEEADPLSFILICQVAGRSTLEQAGRTVNMGPGQLALINSSQPCHFRFGTRNINYSLRIPGKALNWNSVNWTERLAVSVPVPVAGVLESVIRQAFDYGDAFSAEQNGVISDTITRLLATDWKQSAPSPHWRGASAGLVEVQGYIAHQLGTECLNAARIASTFEMSERRLQRLFEQTGMTVGEWIWHERLLRCAADLRDLSKRSRTLTEIAFEWGFKDAAHFSRRFRKAFERSPSEYRAAAILRWQETARGQSASAKPPAVSSAR